MTTEFATEAEVLDGLRKMFDPQSSAFLPHVANATGTRKERTADLVVVGLWPSRGLEIEGFEIKVSRGDWLRELKEPEKSAPIQRYCDRWWIVAGKSGIVLPEELPPTWGLIQPHGKGLRKKVHAPPLDPVPLDRGFVAAVMRAAVMHEVPDATIQRERADAFEDGIKAGIERERRSDRVKRQYAELRERVQAFEDAAGIDVGDPYGSSWGDEDSVGHADPGELGRAVRAVLNGEADSARIMRRLRGLSDDINRLVGKYVEEP